jgi:multicomponent Na+:H+ antiporter subunit B
VILAGGILLAELAGTGSIVRRVAPLAMLEALESSGAAGYAAIGAIGLAGGAYFHNWLPRGTVGELASAGTIPVANVVVTLEVTSAFLLVWSELRDRSLILKDDRGESER